MNTRTDSAHLSTGHIQPRSLKDDIVEVLQRDIICGAYEPGDRLVERDLTRRFGVSSIPVREALRELESRGLVTIRHNYGCSVIELDEGELEEICKLRRTLEPVVVGWAAEKMTPEDAMRLEAQMDKVAAAADEDDVVSFFYEDLILHQMMWAVSRNRYAVRALAIVTGSLFASGLMRLRSSGALDMKREVAKHRDLMEALKSGQPQRAHDVLLGIANGFETHLKGTG